MRKREKSGITLRILALTIDWIIMSLTENGKMRVECRTESFGHDGFEMLINYPDEEPK